MTLTAGNPEIGDHCYGGIVFMLRKANMGSMDCTVIEDLTDGASDPFGWGFNGYEWGCVDEILGAELNIGAGLINTIDVFSECDNDVSAASVSYNYDNNEFSDWYLPSFHELVLLDSLIELSGSYWSSSQRDQFTSFGIGFSDGDSYAAKGGHHKVRVVRLSEIGQWVVWTHLLVIITLKLIWLMKLQLWKKVMIVMVI